MAKNKTVDQLLEEINDIGLAIHYYGFHLGHEGNPQREHDRKVGLRYLDHLSERVEILKRVAREVRLSGLKPDAGRQSGRRQKERDERTPDHRSQRIAQAAVSRKSKVPA